MCRGLGIFVTPAVTQSPASTSTSFYSSCFDSYGYHWPLLGTIFVKVDSKTTELSNLGQITHSQHTHLLPQSFQYHQYELEAQSGREFPEQSSQGQR